MPIKVFISYSWDSEEHQDWIANLAATLRRYGIQADFDSSKVQYNLYQMMVQKISSYDKIVVVVTQRYTDKANSFSGGVGTETKLLLNHYVNDESKIVVVKRENCDVPFYLQGYEFIDLSIETESSIENLVRKINDIPKYSLPSVEQVGKTVGSKQVDGFNMGNLIPDLRAATPEGKGEYLREQFNIADKKILELLQQTKQKNPGFNVEHEKREVNVPSGSSVWDGNSLRQKVNHYTVSSYYVKYQGKEAYYKIWLSLSDSMMGKGIFGNSERPLFSGNGQEFNSYQLWIYVSSSTTPPHLDCSAVLGGGQILDGKDLGKYIFKHLMEQLQRI